MSLRLIPKMPASTRHIPENWRHLCEKRALLQRVALSGCRLLMAVLKFWFKLFNLLGHELILLLEMLHLLDDLRVASWAFTLLVIIKGQPSKRGVGWVRLRHHLSHVLPAFIALHTLIQHYMLWNLLAQNLRYSLASLLCAVVCDFQMSAWKLWVILGLALTARMFHGFAMKFLSDVVLKNVGNSPHFIVAPLNIHKCRISSLIWLLELYQLLHNTFHHPCVLACNRFLVLNQLRFLLLSLNEALSLIRQSVLQQKLTEPPVVKFLLSLRTLAQRFCPNRSA